MAPRYDAVLFDLDDTLWHFEESPSPEEISRALGPRIEAVITGWGDQRPTISFSELDLVLFAARQDGIAAQEARGDHREPDFDELHMRELARHGIEATRAQARELHLAMKPAPEVLRPRLFDGVREAVEALRGAGVRLGAVTNRSHRSSMLESEFEYHGLLEDFDAIVTAGDTGLRKPHPAIVERALADLDVGAERAVLAGDDPVRDMGAARAAGVTSVLVRHRGVGAPAVFGGAHEEPGEGADHLVGSMAELVGLVLG